MLANASHVSVAQIGFLNQMQQLQACGYLRSSVDFQQALETTLQMGYQRLSSPNGAVLPPAARFAQAFDVSSAVNRAMGEALRFEPHVAFDFKPLQALTVRGRRGETVPVIVEKRSYRDALAVVRSLAARLELNGYRELLNRSDMQVMVFLMRDWRGEVHALSIAALYEKPNGDKSLLCCRDIKFDRNRETALRDVGPILTLARLVYMKKAGHWPVGGTVLEDIRPEVLSSYRSRFPRPLSAVRGEWSVSAAEGDHMLIANRFDLIKLPLRSS